jgi:hypothetical protein
VIYKTKVFDRWASDQGLTDLNLCNAVSEMVQGLYDAELGGNLVKKESQGQDKVNGEAFVL